MIIHEEDSQVAMAMRAQTVRHATQLREAEEIGYERGLADGRKLGAK